MTFWGILAIIILGVLLILIELLIIPGVTVAGIAGIIIIGFGVYLSYKTFGTTAGNYTLGGALLFLIITLSISFSSNTWKRASLNSQITGTASDIRSSGLQQGDKGTTVTRLNPVGKVLINDQIYEARSEEGFVDQQKEITVHKVLNTQLIVKQIKK